jgi:hypothetical protein
VRARPPGAVAHLAGAVVVAEESGDGPAKAFVGKAGDGIQDGARGAGQGYCWCVPKRRAAVRWPLGGRTGGCAQQRRADGTALAGSLDHHQPPVDTAGFVERLEGGEVKDSKVGRLVDHGLDAQGAVVVEVLLDARVLGAQLEAHVGAG